MKSINQKTINIICAVVVIIILLFTLKKCNSSILDNYKVTELQKLEKQYREKELVLLDSIRVKDIQYSVLKQERNRLDSLRKISKDRVVYITKYKVYKLAELKTFSSDSQLALLKENLNDTNIIVIDSNVFFDTTHIQLINYKFLESDLQKEELKAVYTDMALCDSSYQVLDTMLINRNSIIVLKDSTIAVEKQISQTAINMRENYKTQLKKEKRKHLIDNILIPSLTGIAGVGAGYLIFKFTK